MVLPALAQAGQHAGSAGPEQPGLNCVGFAQWQPALNYARLHRPAARWHRLAVLPRPHVRPGAGAVCERG
jgi:hypothetical protein